MIKIILFCILYVSVIGVFIYKANDISEDNIIKVVMCIAAFFIGYTLIAMGGVWLQ